MKKSALTITAFVLTILLALVAGVYPFFERGGQPGAGAMGVRDGQFQGNFPQRNPPDGQPGRPGLETQPQGEFPGNGSNGQSFQPGSNMPSNSMMSFRLLRVLNLGLAALIILLGGISAIGLWKERNWGRGLAIITASIALVSILPTLLRQPGIAIMITPLVKILLAIAVIIFAILARKKSSIIVEPT